MGGGGRAFFDGFWPKLGVLVFWEWVYLVGNLGNIGSSSFLAYLGLLGMVGIFLGGSWIFQVSEIFSCLVCRW